MKKKTTIIRLFAVLSALMSVTGATAYDFVSDGIYYNITGRNTVEVTCDVPYSDCYGGCVYIPCYVAFNDMIYEVTRIGDSAFAYCKDLESVSIPPSVVEIGASAFNFCSSLTSVILPESMCRIGNMAFTACTNLSTVHCLAVIPPRISSSTFDKPVIRSATLIVPWGSQSDYLSDNTWKNFTIIQEMPELPSNGCRH